MSAADHPSRYQPPHRVLKPMRPLEAAKRAHDEFPDLLAGIEWLLGMSTPFQERQIAQAPWKEAP